MTIHWKAVEENFLMDPLLFRFNFWRRNTFSEFFSKKTPSLKRERRGGEV
jgi:hypothetical protein